jgi:hypothetical protein
MSKQISRFMAAVTGQPLPTMTDNIATITLGAQTSGEDERTIKQVFELRKLLAITCKGP